MRTTQTTPGVLVLGGSVVAGPTRTTNAPTAAAARWSFTAAAYVSLVSVGDNSVQPTLTADRSQPHLEARYHYETQNATSLWAGYKFGGGEPAVQTKARDRLAATAT